MKIYDIITASTKQTESLGESFSHMLCRGDFVAMYGTLGAGKTAFVRGMAKHIAPGASAHSPTYTIVNEYRSNDASLFHFDVYRIEGEDDLYSTGFYDYKDGIVAVEWSEKIEFAFPDSYYKVTIEKRKNENERHIIIEHIGPFNRMRR